MFNWFKKKRVISKVPVNIALWHYTCENNHKWKSTQSPRSTFLYGEDRQTKCPLCKTPICMGEVYINGERTNSSAIHIGYPGRRKK